MNDKDQKQLGKTLWAIADQLRGAMNADDFRDYMLAFLFLRYLSDNYESAAKKELGRDYPDPTPSATAGSPLALWYAENPNDVADFEKQMRRKVHYVIKPDTSGPASPTWPAPRTANCSTRCRRGSSTSRTSRSRARSRGCSRRSTSARTSWAKTYADRNAKLCTIIQKIAEGLADFSTDTDTLGDAYEYLIGQFAAGSGKKAGEFYTPQQISRHPLGDRHARQPGAEDRQEEAAGQPCSTSPAAPARCC